MSRFPKTVHPRVLYRVTVKRKGVSFTYVGETLTSALTSVGVSEEFVYSKYERGPEMVGKLGLRRTIKNPHERVR